MSVEHDMSAMPASWIGKEQFATARQPAGLCCVPGWRRSMKRVELHEMKMEGDVMKMRAVPAIELPPGQEVELRHGQRYHLMLLDLTQPLKKGDRFELSLMFERAGEAKVKVWLQQPKAREARGHSH